MSRKLDGSTTEPAIQSCDIGQWIPCFDSCQLNTLIKKGEISRWLPRQSDGRRSRDYQNRELKIGDVFGAMATSTGRDVMIRVILRML